MGPRRYGLRDDQWDRIKDLLPGRAGTEGRPARDNRLFVEAVLYRYRAGIPWRDLPERFGDFRVVHTRFTRWAQREVWKQVLEQLAQDADKGFDAEARVLEPLRRAGKLAVIPARAKRLYPRTYDKELYKARHLIENFFAKLKQFQAIATRYDKTRRNFLAAVQLASAYTWLV
jgi:transposase